MGERVKMKLNVALLLVAVLACDGASVRSRKGRSHLQETLRTFYPFISPPQPLSTLAKVAIAKGALAAGVGAYGLYDWVTRGTNVGFKAGLGVGPVSLDAAAGFGISPAEGVKVEENLPVVWLTDEEWDTNW